MRRVLILFLVTVAIGVATLYGASLWLAKRSEARYPPIGQYAEVDGKQIHYIDSGEPVTASEPELCGLFARSCKITFVFWLSTVLVTATANANHNGPIRIGKPLSFERLCKVWASNAVSGLVTPGLVLSSWQVC